MSLIDDEKPIDISTIKLDDYFLDQLEIQPWSKEKKEAYKRLRFCELILEHQDWNSRDARYAGTERYKRAHADHQAALSGYDHALSVFEGISDD